MTCFSTLTAQLSPCTSREQSLQQALIIFVYHAFLYRPWLIKSWDREESFSSLGKEMNHVWRHPKTMISGCKLYSLSGRDIERNYRWGWSGCKHVKMETGSVSPFSRCVGWCGRQNRWRRDRSCLPLSDWRTHLQKASASDLKREGKDISC